MNPYFKEFLQEFPPQPDAIAIPKTRIDEYESRLPRALLDFWMEIGWSGFADGILWSTDPEAFEVVIASWLDGTDFLKNQTYTVIARSAFGQIFLWGKQSGMNIIIEPLFGTVTIFESNFDEKKENSSVIAFFVSKEKTYFDFNDWKEKPLFNKALRKLGPLQSDEMYGFEPALSIGGVPKLDNLVKVKMIEHLVLLSQLHEIEFVHMDVRRHS